MRILSKNKIDRFAKEAARMERKILDEKQYEIGAEFADELTAHFERLIRMVGGEYGYGQYAAQIVSYYTSVSKEERKMGKVIAIK